MERALRVSSSRLAWLATLVLGAVGLWLGLAAMAWRVGPDVQDRVDWAGVLLVGLGIVAVLAWISVRVTARIFYRKRMEDAGILMVSYGLVFGEDTEKLQQRLGAPPQKGTT